MHDIYTGYFNKEPTKTEITMEKRDLVLLIKKDIMEIRHRYYVYMFWIHFEYMLDTL